MSTIVVVSTFPFAHANIYGNVFLKECGVWGIPLTLVCYENFQAVPSAGERRLDARLGAEYEDYPIWRWLQQSATIPHTVNYRFQITRFAWKVFAMTMPVLRTDNVDWIVWLDADVRVQASPDWDALLNTDADVCYLGRTDWDHSETGFVAWNLRRRGEDALASFRALYTTGMVFAESQWHDAYLFDRLRERLKLICHNLSPAARGLDAWSASPLATWSVHNKGLDKFKDTANAASRG